MCFGGPKELSHGDGSFEYPQHMFWLRNKKNNFQLRTLIWGPGMIDFILLFSISDQVDSKEYVWRNHGVFIE